MHDIYYSNAENNVLINSASSNDVTQCLFQIALKYAEKGYEVLYLSERRIDELPECEQNLGKHTDILRNITFRHCKTLRALLKTFLEIHTWRSCPRVIMLESLHTFFTQPSSNAPARVISDAEFAEHHSLLIASLQNAVESLSKKSGAKCASIASTNFSATPHYDQFRSVLVDLYYANHKSSDNITNELSQFLKI